MGATSLSGAPQRDVDLTASFGLRPPRPESSQRFRQYNTKSYYNAVTYEVNLRVQMTSRS